MMKMIGLVLALLASGAEAQSGPVRRLTPAEAIVAADAAPTLGVEAQVGFVVRTVGADRGVLYLNSEADYRDPRNLSVSASPAVVRDLRTRFGEDLERVFRGRAVVARGRVRPVPIRLVERRGSQAQRGYSQHRLRLARAADIEIVAGA